MNQTIAATDPYERRRIAVLDTEMAYVDTSMPVQGTPSCSSMETPRPPISGGT